MKSIGQFIILALLSACFSCASHSKKDVAPVLIQKLEKYGAKLQTAQVSLTLANRWSVKEDASGFVFNVSGITFEEMDGLLRKLFPNKGVRGGTDTGALLRFRRFNKQESGVGLHMIETSDGVQINCITTTFW